jgi:NADH-quinone oxidoreductase subunit C
VVLDRATGAALPDPASRGALGSRVAPPDLAAAKRALDAALAGIATEPARFRGDLLMVEVPPGKLVDAARIVRDHDGTRCDFLSVIAGVDTGTQLGTVTIAHGTRSGVWVGLRTWVSENDPRIPTLVQIWPGADWHEREAYDMFGITFDGHPDLRRVFLEADFPGHPLRKSFMPPRSDARGG